MTMRGERARAMLVGLCCVGIVAGLVVVVVAAAWMTFAP